MEDTLRDMDKIEFKSMLIENVLILVLMEDTLRVHFEVNGKTITYKS